VSTQFGLALGAAIPCILRIFTGLLTAADEDKNILLKINDKAATQHLFCATEDGPYQEQVAPCTAFLTESISLPISSVVDVVEEALLRPAPGAAPCVALVGLLRQQQHPWQPIKLHTISNNSR